MNALARAPRLRRWLPIAAIVGSYGSSAQAEVTFEVALRDPAGYGFFDPLPVAPVGDNPGTTLGEQRVAALHAALDIWSRALEGAVPVRIGASFLASVSCAVAAGAEPERYVSGEVGLDARFAYPVALAERILGRDVNAGGVDIELFFNEQFCELRSQWYLGLDGQPESNEIDFVTIALHELAHGLGLTTRASVYDGGTDDGTVDAFASLLYDTSTSTAWPEMTQDQRAASVLRPRALAWGAEATRRYAREHLEFGFPQLTTSSSVQGLLGLLSETNVGPRVAGRTTARLRPSGAGAACEPLVNNGVPSILLASGAGCSLRAKAETARAAGAEVLLIISTSTTSPPPPLLVEGEVPLPLPVYGVTRDDGQRLESTAGLTLTVETDPIRLVGADLHDRPLVFSGSPPVPGVNLVHWDTLLRPGGLLRPVIGPGVVMHEVGLEAAALRDLGWPTVCGNGRVDDGEECDWGDGSDSAKHCRTDCRHPRCGDRIVEPAKRCDTSDSDGTCATACSSATPTATWSDGGIWTAASGTHADASVEHGDGTEPVGRTETSPLSRCTNEAVRSDAQVVPNDASPELGQADAPHDAPEARPNPRNTERRGLAGDSCTCTLSTATAPAASLWVVTVCAGLSARRRRRWRTGAAQSVDRAARG